MPSEQPVTHWIDQLKAGDHAAAQKLWESYFHQLVRLARENLRGVSRRAADEEDVALSAFDSFCRGVEHGRFPQLHDRDNLWSLLVTITVRKARHLVRDEQRQKRGGGAVVGESGLFAPENGGSLPPGLDRLVGAEPSPAFAAQVADECRRLLHQLQDAELESVAVWKMEGYSNQEIAAKLGCALRSVERKLRVIRTLWSQEAPA